MTIFINGKPAEITLDTEKTLGDVMSGIEQWISPTGNRIQKISVDGKEVSGDSLPEAFRASIAEIEKLDILVSSWRELAAEALFFLRDTCAFYREAPFDERPRISGGWAESSAARFLRSDIPELFSLAEKTLSGDGLSAADFIGVVEERLREVSDPWKETCRMEAEVELVSKRMEELPLDMQTGKDARAAETVQLFSHAGEKLFRIFFIHKSEGLPADTFLVDGLPARAFIEDFGSALRELSGAYENQDTVLAGDIAEYELAPRLLKFFTALKNLTNSSSPISSGS